MTENEPFGSFFVQDVHSGYGPIEYTAIPLEPFGAGAGYKMVGRDGEESAGSVAAECLGRLHSWGEYFHGPKEEEQGTE